MVRSNEQEPLLIGHIVRFEKYNSCYMPIVEGENGKEYIASGIVLPYDRYLYDIISKLSYVQQYDMMRDLVSFHSNLRTAMENNGKKEVSGVKIKLTGRFWVLFALLLISMWLSGSFCWFVGPLIFGCCAVCWGFFWCQILRTYGWPSCSICLTKAD